jgi:DNA repair protein RecO (recombination protein O)
VPLHTFFQCQGLVLKSAPLGEAGLIVTLYSRESGKLRAVVHGARKPTSRLVGHFEPLNLLHLSLASSRPEGIDTITQAQILDGHAPLKGNLDAISRAIYVLDLVDGFGAEGSANPQLYELLLDTLAALGRSPDEGMFLRYFELHLLGFSGFMPELYRCVECRRELRPGEHRYSPELGGTLCPRCTPAGPRIMHLSVQALKVLRFVDKAGLAQSSQLRVPSGLQDELKNLLSATLSYWLDREIRSKSFLEHLEHSHEPAVPAKGG